MAYSHIPGIFTVYIFLQQVNKILIDLIHFSCKNNLKVLTGKKNIQHTVQFIYCGNIYFAGILQCEAQTGKTMSSFGNILRPADIYKNKLCDIFIIHRMLLMVAHR